MKFTECDINEIVKKKRSNLTKLLFEFRDCEIKCAKLKDWKYCSPRCGAGTINRRAKGLKMPHIKAVVRDEEIYLVNNALVVKEGL